MGFYKVNGREPYLNLLDNHSFRKPEHSIINIPHSRLFLTVSINVPQIQTQTLIQCPYIVNHSNIVPILSDDKFLKVRRIRTNPGRRNLKISPCIVFHVVLASNEIHVTTLNLDYHTYPCISLKPRPSYFT